jgi:hypothetical protein
MDLFKLAISCWLVIQHMLTRLNLKETPLDKKSSFEDFCLTSREIRAATEATLPSLYIDKTREAV